MKQLCILLLTLLSLNVNGQEFKIGFKAGVNSSNFTSKQDNHKSLTGFHAGITFPILFGDNFIIQPEIIYSAQGAKISGTGLDGDYKINYITVPVMLRSTIYNGFYLESGVQAGFKTSESHPKSNQQFIPKSTDFALNIGLGYQVKSGFGIGLRYCYGLTKISDETTFFDTVTKSDYKNEVIQAFLFYTLFND